MTDLYDTPKLSTVNLPPKKYTTYRILQSLLNGGGTFWQLCERLDIPTNTKRYEASARSMFDSLQICGHIYKVGIVYHISPATRSALVPPAPYHGQVAGPRYRGPNQAMPVTIYRRESRA